MNVCVCRCAPKICRSLHIAVSDCRSQEVERETTIKWIGIIDGMHLLLSQLNAECLDVCFEILDLAQADDGKGVWRPVPVSE